MDAAVSIDRVGYAAIERVGLAPDQAVEPDGGLPAVGGALHFAGDERLEGFAATVPAFPETPDEAVGAAAIRRARDEAVDLAVGGDAAASETEVDLVAADGWVAESDLVARRRAARFAREGAVPGTGRG